MIGDLEPVLHGNEKSPKQIERRHGNPGIPASHQPPAALRIALAARAIPVTTLPKLPWIPAQRESSTEPPLAPETLPVKLAAR